MLILLLSLLISSYPNVSFDEGMTGVHIYNSLYNEGIPIVLNATNYQNYLEIIFGNTNSLWYFGIFNHEKLIEEA